MFVAKISEFNLSQVLIFNLFVCCRLILHIALKDKQNKGIRWMPWRRKAMKDVTGCDKPRVAANKL